MRYEDGFGTRGQSVTAPTIEHETGSEAVLAATRPGQLTQLEWRVVELARGDGIETLRPQHPRNWLGRIVFGPTPPSAILANKRLEALRRLEVQAWHYDYALPVSAMKDAVAACYSEIQVKQIIEAIAGLRRVAA
ncbi:hypothetical protein MB02_12380 [Croceicoccus estronivorus]|uniref:hypothetical protein n=1 Tax=Croceicoccus estronivorus TaxID=1172626 RepID=UPI00082F2F5A|nr:hypothetical protein [Croceicoccus estronivorus]OCC23406.1 hypothetical protein MB02_12380 [Croceicoccus estronivorus]